MASPKTSLLDHDFSFPLHTKNISLQIVNFLLKYKFIGEIEISTIVRSFRFHKKYLSSNIYYHNIICELFTLTFVGQIKELFGDFTIETIHSWEYFRYLSISAHKNYDYEQLCEEFEYIYRNEDDSISKFNSRIIWNYYIFEDSDKQPTFIKQGCFLFIIPFLMLKKDIL